MGELGQTVWISVVGMGLTFAAIGLLIAAMAALTRWARGAERAAPGRAETGAAIPTSEELEEAEQAAAVAVAIALALEARHIHPTRSWHSAYAPEEPGAWQAYARGQQLEQGKTHQTLRW